MNYELLYNGEASDNGDVIFFKDTPTSEDVKRYLLQNVYASEITTEEIEAGYGVTLFGVGVWNVPTVATSYSFRPIPEPHINPRAKIGGTPKGWASVDGGTVQG